MCDRPIIFSAPMVQALLAGRKTQTRRVIKPRPWNKDGDCVDINIAPTAKYMKGADGRFYYQFDHPLGGPLTGYVAQYAPGDRLYVREAWRAWWEYNETSPAKIPSGAAIQYAADDPLSPWDTRPRSPIHMPRWASRLTLTITDVRVQRLQEVTAIDAINEGIASTWGDWMGEPPDWAVASIEGYGDASGSHIWDNRTSVENFGLLWKTIHGPGAWDANPWVIALTFTVARGNIDADA